MPFCTKCGAQVQGQFCTGCGSPVAGGHPAPAAPPPFAAAPVVAGPAAAAPARKGTSPWVWVGVAVLGFFLLIALAVGGLVFYGIHKAKQAGLDPELIKNNPGLAVAKMVVAANPDLEVLRMDERRGLITIREKSTGKTTTVDFEAVKQGRITFKDDKGESVTIQGDSGGLQMRGANGETVSISSGGEAKVPSWLPSYPDAKAEGRYTGQSGDEEAGAFGFATKDSAKKVLEFYNQGLKSAGLNISSQFNQESGDSAGGKITAEDEATHRSVIVTVGTENGETAVNVAYTIKK